MLSKFKVKVARKFYGVPASAYLSADDVNDACVCTALMYFAIASGVLGAAVCAMAVAAAIAQAFGW